jgi:hypothetical protein
MDRHIIFQNAKSPLADFSPKKKITIICHIKSLYSIKGLMALNKICLTYTFGAVKKIRLHSYNNFFLPNIFVLNYMLETKSLINQTFLGVLRLLI